MKKSILAMSLLLLISAFANAQLSITPYVQGDFSHYFFSPESSEKEAAKDYKEVLRPRLSYTFGVNMNYYFNERWSLQTGLMFQEMGEQILETDFPIPVQATWEAYSISHHYQFINIPIQARYNFATDGKFSPYIAFGTALNVNTQSFINSTLHYPDETSETTKIPVEDLNDFDVRLVNFSTKVDIGFSYKLNDRLNLETFLSSNILLLTTSENHIYKPRNFNIGLGIGVGYSI